MKKMTFRWRTSTQRIERRHFCSTKTSKFPVGHEQSPRRPVWPPFRWIVAFRRSPSVGRAFQTPLWNTHAILSRTYSGTERKKKGDRIITPDVLTTNGTHKFVEFVLVFGEFRAQKTGQRRVKGRSAFEVDQRGVCPQKWKVIALKNFFKKTTEKLTKKRFFFVFWKKSRMKRLCVPCDFSAETAPHPTSPYAEYCCIPWTGRSAAGDCATRRYHCRPRTWGSSH